MDLNRPSKAGGLLGAFIDKMKDEEYRTETFYPALLDLGYDLAPGTGEVRSGMRADKAFGRAAGHMQGGEYIPAMADYAEGAAEWLGAIPALGVALSAPMDLARAGKKLFAGGKKGLLQPDIPYSPAGTPTSNTFTAADVMAVADQSNKKTDIEKYGSQRHWDKTKDRPARPPYSKSAMARSGLEDWETYKNTDAFESRYSKNPPISLYEGMESKPALSESDLPNLERYEAAKGAKARTADALVNKELREKLIDSAFRGQAIMGGKRWYPTNELYQYYIQELGEEAGKAKFIRDINIQAASSSNVKMQDLPRVASWYQYQAAQGMPITPPPKGSGFGAQYSANQHAPTVKKYLETGQMDEFGNPKRATFTQNLLGRESQVTIDKHNMRAIGMLSGDPRFMKTTVEISEKQARKYRDMGFDVGERQKKHGKTGKMETIYTIQPQKEFDKGNLEMSEAQQTPILWEEAPANNEYKYLEELQQSIAKELNMTPAEFQENLWIGAGQMTGLGSPPERAIDTIEKRVRYTAERLGADPEEVMRAYVRGDIPLAQRQDMMEQYGGLLG